MLALTPGVVVSLQPQLRRARLPSGELFLISETTRFLIPAGPLARVVALIDGRRSLEELQLAAPELTPAELIVALDELDAAGYLTLPDSFRPREERAFWRELGVPVAAPGRSFGAVSVETVAAAQSRWQSVLEDALRESGVRVVSADSGQAALRIVLTPDYLAPALSSWERVVRSSRTTWLPVKPSGTRAFFGPLFDASTGPCWTCLTHALSRNRPVEQFIARESDVCQAESAVQGAVAASLSAALNLAALQVAQLLAGAPRASGWRDRLLELRFDSLQTIAHTVVRRPQCPDCGNPELMRAHGEASVRLTPVEKSHDLDGGYRSCTPHETYERYRHLISPVTGAVTHLGPMPGRHGPECAVYTCGYLVCPSDRALGSNIFDKACAGKGRSEEQARASALCEALERSSSVYQGDEARRRGSRRSLGAEALHLDALQLFSERQLSLRKTSGLVRDVRTGVPLPFDVDAAIDWTPGWSLSHDARRYVPLAYCFAEVPEDAGTRFCQFNPNGTAAGNCPEEAILHGCLELIERDAAALWWYNRVLRPRVDVEAFADGFCDRTLARYRERGLHCWILNLTSDLGIYVFAAISHEPVRDRFTMGLGCHLDARIAMQRAFAELNQLFDPEGEQVSSWDHQALRNRDFLFPDPDVSPVTPDQLPDLGGRDLAADILGCVERLRRQDLELIVVDKTRPDVGAAVVQVIVPGLRHFWPRFAPGRLYVVPAKLGWVPRPASEDDLNPVPLFL